MRLRARCALVEGRWRYVVDAFLYVFERLWEVVVSLLGCGVGSAGRHGVDLEGRTVKHEYNFSHHITQWWKLARFGKTTFQFRVDKFSQNILNQRLVKKAHAHDIISKVEKDVCNILSASVNTLIVSSFQRIQFAKQGCIQN